MRLDREACRAASLNAAVAERRGSETPPCIKRGLRWLAAALVAAVTPKCLLCLAGYVAAGGAAVELCGGTPDNAATVWLIGGAVGTSLLAFGLWRARKKRGGVSGRGGTVR